MPRGGRRTGAGAPKGNFNAVRAGAYSRRMRLTLAMLLTVPEYRLVIRSLYRSGEKAHQEVTELMIASARLMYDTPVNEELRQLVAKAATNFVDKVGPEMAQKFVAAEPHRIGVEELMPRQKKRVSRHNLSTERPVFREFVKLLTGITVPVDNQPDQPISGLTDGPSNPEGDERCDR